MKRWLIVLLVLLVPLAALAQDNPQPVQKALDDLNQRLGRNLTLKDFNWQWTKGIFNDSSLGCPMPGQTYVSGSVSGYTVQFYLDNVMWDYRVSSDLETVILCSPLATPTPTPRLTNTPPAMPTRQPGVEPTAAPRECPGSPALRLAAGGRGRVVPEGLPNNVRKQPGTSSQLIGEIKPDTVFYVLDGPACASGLAWWYVADTNSDLIGWTPEGLGNTYWLEPVSTSEYVTPTRTGNVGGFATNTPNAIGSGGQVLQPTPTASGLPTLRPGGQPTLTPGYFGPTPTIPGYQFGGPTPTVSGFQPGGFQPTNTPPPYMATPTRYPTLTGNFGVCNGAPQPRLSVGGKGRVTPGLPNNLRQQPGTSSTYLGEIPSGGVFTVQDGPTCASGMWWWQVNYNNVIGWTPEGQGTIYWVEPIYN